MRIVGGAFKGRRLSAVGSGDKAAHLRPTTDRNRESLFNILNNMIDFDDMRVLDVFAGTGALGCEALSRGAAFCTFVDSGRKAGQIISANIGLLNVADQSKVLNLDLGHLPENSDDGYDVVFCDPPYGKGLADVALSQTIAKGWIAEDAIIVVEDTQPPVTPPGFDVMKSQSYGKTILTFLRAPR